MKFKQVILGHWRDSFIALGEDGIVYKWLESKQGWVALPSTLIK